MLHVSHHESTSREVAASASISNDGRCQISTGELVDEFVAGAAGKVHRFTKY